MNSREEFQAKLASGNIEEAINFLVSKAIELKVTTWIVTKERDNTTTAESAENNNRVPSDSCLTTNYNLLEGIEHQLGKSILTSESYLEVREYHLSQVDRLDRSIKSNLEAIESIAAILERNKLDRTVKNVRDKKGSIDPDFPSHSESNGNFQSDNYRVSDKVISRVNKSSVLFLADENLIASDLLHQLDENDVELSHPRKQKLNQEDWGDWLDLPKEPVEENSIDSVTDIN